MSRRIDLTGRTFGRLQVQGVTDKRSGSSVVWRCRCACGSVVDVSALNLLHRGTVSCGCHRREQAVKNLGGDVHERLGLIDGTNVSLLRSTSPQKNNSSGYRGVSWHKNQHGGGAWIAIIYFQRTRFRLGFFATPQEASAAYLEAKEHLHGDFVAWYNKTIKAIRETPKEEDPHG